MERIGDHAADISELELMLEDLPPLSNDHLREMATQTSVMLIRSIESFAERDAKKAQWVIDQDDVVDELFDRVKNELILSLIHICGTDAAQYEALLCRVVSERLCEAIDVELSVGEERFSRVVRAAHASGVSVVGSSHRFDGTPEAGKMIRTLRLMEQLEADVCKIAVMPHSREDVLTLMEAGIRADAQLTVPLIAIAMGPLGILTRLGAQWLGSCLTFGTAGQESAPGQMEAGALRRGLEMVSTALPHG